MYPISVLGVCTRHKRESLAKIHGRNWHVVCTKSVVALVALTLIPYPTARSAFNTSTTGRDRPISIT